MTHAVTAAIDRRGGLRRAHRVDRSGRAGRRRRRPGTVASIDDLLGSVDAVVIAAASSAHADLIHACADAGLPTFCEKPITVDLASHHGGRGARAARQGSSSRWGSSVDSTPATGPPADLVADGGDRHALRRPDGGPRPRSAAEEYIAASGRDLPRLQHPRLRRAPVRDGAGDRGGLRGRIRHRVSGCSREYGDVDSAVATLRLSGGSRRDPVRHAPRPARVRHPDGAVRLGRQRVGRVGCQDAAPVPGAGDAAGPGRNVREVPRAFRGCLSGRDGARSSRWQRDGARTLARRKTPSPRFGSRWRATPPARSTDPSDSKRSHDAHVGRSHRGRSHHVGHLRSAWLGPPDGPRQGARRDGVDRAPGDRNRPRGLPPGRSRTG